MNDPHVTELCYQVASDAETKYLDPEPLSFTHALGSFLIEDGLLTVSPAEHFAREREARAAVDPYLQAWEVDTALKTNPGTILFEFLRSTVVDRLPLPDGASRVIEVEAGAICIASATATLVVGRRNYPEPPTGFGLTSEVQSVYRRWLAQRKGGEPILSFAYFLVTLIESKAKDRKAAALQYGVDVAILKKVGELTAQRGDVSVARKVGKQGKHGANLTAAETSFLEGVVRRLVRRLGEHAHGGALEQITVLDFPLP